MLAAKEIMMLETLVAAGTEMRGSAPVNFQVLFNIVVAAMFGMGGWILGRITKTLDNMDADLRKLPHTYVTKEQHDKELKQFRLDTRDGMQDVKDSLARIEAALAQKQDK